MQVRKRLNTGGICVQWAAKWAPRITNSFLAAFPYVIERDHVLLGSDQPFEFDVDAIVKRLEEPYTREYLAATPWSSDKIAQLMRGEPVKTWDPRSRQDADKNTDLFPRDEFFLNKN